ncbi:unnamed protein product [Arctia plantaginis]|uniref:Mutator-like transposase domain-containing protein n=1 Tax=Arctia plantaginis TaxID=874455 RepID=A0A8S0ZBD4_ARCPL|nr:unnamed protein product [Arctia plantaginis]
MGNKKNKRKRARLRHLETVRANGRRTAALRWSSHNKENNEAIFISSKISDEHTEKNRSPSLMQMRTLSPTSCESSYIGNCMDENRSPLVQLHTVSPITIPSNDKSLIIEEECEDSMSETHKDDPNPTNNVNINTAVCSGIVAAGIGYSQLEEICSAIDVPIFTEKYFAKVQSKVFDDWEATAIEAMEAAANQERKVAIAEGRVKDGKPVIDVYVDGAWCTRSYGNNYRALSGVAAIVGRRSGEVLFIGVKNKYCLICARAEKKEETPKEHLGSDSARSKYFARLQAGSPAPAPLKPRTSPPRKQPSPELTSP